MLICKVKTKKILFVKLTGPSFNFFQFGRSRCADDELWGKMLIFAEKFCGDGNPAFDERYSSLSVGRALNRACGTASCRKHFSLMKKELEDQLTNTEVESEEARTGLKEYSQRCP